MLEETRPPRFVMWSLSAMAIIAMQSCAPAEEHIPGNPEVDSGTETRTSPPSTEKRVSDSPEGDDPRGQSARSAVCVAGEEPIFYEFGDMPCARDSVRISDNEHMEIRFRVTDENATDPYDYGYRELLRYRDDRVIETLRLRHADDPPWSQVPFVRIRRQQYLADLDGDGHLEFAVFPFSPGSAIWGTVRMYSLKDGIEPWGEGVYRFELDTFVQLDCMMCSKFDPEECEKCR